MIKAKAFAKLNLNLHVLPYNFNKGYHQIKFINCQINLFDELLFKPIKKKIEGIAEDNLIYKAAILLKKLAKNQDLGARIYLKKNIPIKAGLAGGSSDAAVTIIKLAKLWKIKLNKLQSDYLADKLGKDVYYCLQGGLCQIEGDGSQVIPLSPKLPKFWLVIITPEEKKPSTKWMYDNLDISNIGKNLSKLEGIKQAIRFKDKKNILENLYNDFESLAINCYPKITIIKNDLINSGALNTLLSGSGFSTVGFYNTKNKAVNAFKYLKVKYKNIFYVSTK